MSPTIQIRNVPVEVSRTFKARAAAEGQSLSDYLLGELQRIAARPTRRELVERIEQRGRVDLPPAADVLADQRAGR
ncbi:MAG: toxin-antitoxin system, antitoxin component [Austwickia sp.]|jgi:plasmid stability protein|nr:toxin-antitoxin system, antitoxin component [Austwickia sp.]MBK8437813.1 toxin-antitoxin system, antitoxin component [Austwickia sp.]MBK9100120.1 toxin-antitoxin system, antitoxin component [Austwickia sp.]